MQSTRADIVAEARTWLGTPWVKAGAVKEKGCNCLGFLAGVVRDIGMTGLYDVFSRHEGFALPPEPKTLFHGLMEHLIRIKPAHASPGDILLFDIEGLRHVAMITEPGFIIHCHQGKGKVVEHRLMWRPHSAYVLPGIA